MTEVELDSISRFMLPRSMLRYAGIEKEAIIVGLGNSRYDDFLIKDQQSFTSFGE